MALGCFVSTGRSLSDAVARVQLAEELGYEAAYVTHIAARDSLTVLTAYAAATTRIRLGTGVVPIYTRTPATMAMTAATMHERPAGASASAWASRTARSSRAGTARRSTSRSPRCASTSPSCARSCAARRRRPGEKWRTGFQLSGLDPCPDLPIYVAALSPAMLRLAGEVADGVILWLCNPHYIRDVVMPEVSAGRERAGKTLEGFDIVAAVPAGARRRPGRGVRAMRRDLLPYFGLPFYRAMLERSGFGDDIAAFDEAAGAGDGEAHAGGDLRRFLDALTAVGDADAVRAGVERYARRRRRPRRASARSPRPTSRPRCARRRPAEVEPPALAASASRFQPRRAEGSWGTVRGARRRPRACASWFTRRASFATPSQRFARGCATQPVRIARG